MNIKKLRTEKGYSIEQLAKAAHVTTRQVYNWEKYGLPVVYARLKKIEKLLLTEQSN